MAPVRMLEPTEMKLSQIVKHAHTLPRPFCVSDGRRFRLDRIDPGDTGALDADDKARERSEAERRSILKRNS